MAAERFTLPVGNKVGNSHDGVLNPSGNPSGFSDTFGLPYWQLKQAVNAPPQDRFVRQTNLNQASSQTGPESKTPLAQATQTMQEHLKGWLQKNPDLLEALQDPAQNTASGQESLQKSSSGKKKRRKSTPIEIGETEFSSRTSSGKEPGKCQIYSPYGNMSEGEESGESGGDYSSSDESFSGSGSDYSHSDYSGGDYSGSDFASHDTGSYSAPDTSYVPDTGSVMDYSHDGGGSDYGDSETDYSGDSD
jgi:hypothetical protein